MAKQKSSLDIPKLGDDAEWRAATAKLRELADLCAEAEAAEKRARRNPLRMPLAPPQSRYGEQLGPSQAELELRALREATISALIEGRPPPPTPAASADLDRLEFAAAMLREAVGRQNDKVRTIESRFRGEVLEKFRAADEVNVDAVGRALEELHRALAGVDEFRQQLALAGTAPTTYTNVSAVRHALGAGNPNSPSVVFLRTLAAARSAPRQPRAGAR